MPGVCDQTQGVMSRGNQKNCKIASKPLAMSVVHLDGEYYFQVKLKPAREITYVRRQGDHSKNAKLKPGLLQYCSGEGSLCATGTCGQIIFLAISSDHAGPSSVQQKNMERTIVTAFLRCPSLHFHLSIIVAIFVFAFRDVHHHALNDGQCSTLSPSGLVVAPTFRRANWHAVFCIHHRRSK